MGLQQLLRLWSTRGCSCLGRGEQLLGRVMLLSLWIRQILWVSSRPQVGREVNLSKIRALLLQDPHYSAPFHSPIPNFVLITLCSFFLKLLPPNKLYKVQAQPPQICWVV